MRKLGVLLPVLVTFLVGAAPASAWTWPVTGPVLQPFVLGDDPYAGGQHRGIDIGAPEGAAVVSPAAGIVTFAGSVPGGGRALTVETPDGYAVTLLHLERVAVARGQAVGEGAVVASAGRSGEPEHAESYVHLGVRVAADRNGYLDPLDVLPPRTGSPPPASDVPQDGEAQAPAGSGTDEPELAEGAFATEVSEGGPVAAVGAGEDASSNAVQPPPVAAGATPQVQPPPVAAGATPQPPSAATDGVGQSTIDGEEEPPTSPGAASGSSTSGASGSAPPAETEVAAGALVAPGPAPGGAGADAEGAADAETVRSAPASPAGQKSRRRSTPRQAGREGRSRPATSEPEAPATQAPTAAPQALRKTRAPAVTEPRSSPETGAVPLILGAVLCLVVAVAVVRRRPGGCGAPPERPAPADPAGDCASRPPRPGTRPVLERLDSSDDLPLAA